MAVISEIGELGLLGVKQRATVVKKVDVSVEISTRLFHYSLQKLVRMFIETCDLYIKYIILPVIS